MNVEYRTRRAGEVNNREMEVASTIRAAVRERVEQSMFENKNGIFVTGPKKKLNKQIMQKFKSDRIKRRESE